MTTKIVFSVPCFRYIKIFSTYNNFFCSVFFSQVAKTWNGIKNHPEFFRILVTGNKNRNLKK